MKRICIFIHRFIPLAASECTEEELYEEPRNNNTTKCRKNIWPNAWSSIFLGMKGIHLASQRAGSPSLFTDIKTFCASATDMNLKEKIVTNGLSIQSALAP